MAKSLQPLPLLEIFVFTLFILLEAELVVGNKLVVCQPVFSSRQFHLVKETILTKFYTIVRISLDLGINLGTKVLLFHILFCLNMLGVIPARSIK